MVTKIVTIAPEKEGGTNLEQQNSELHRTVLFQYNLTTLTKFKTTSLSHSPQISLAITFWRLTQVELACFILRVHSTPAFNSIPKTHCKR